MGFTITAKDEPSLYWAGDTVLYPPVEATIVQNRLDVIVIHPCGARWDGDLITMERRKRWQPAGAICTYTRRIMASGRSSC
ncbi:MAG TPA: hypothetical protein VKY22_23300 [Bradyrhizobium sp.]|nr:hypothetical protein [Bradyrhizobium sp.]